MRDGLYRDLACRYAACRSTGDSRWRSIAASFAKHSSHARSSRTIWVPSPPGSSTHLPLPPARGGCQWTSSRFGWRTTRVSTVIRWERVRGGATEPQTSHRNIHSTAGGSAVIGWLGPDDVEWDTRFELSAWEQDQGALILGEPQVSTGSYPSRDVSRCLVLTGGGGSEGRLRGRHRVKVPRPLGRAR
jgi:hypothetical protein